MNSVAIAVAPRKSAQRFQGGLKSPLPGVSSEAWTRFVRALEVQGVKAVSESGGFGAYDLRPRRLVELGHARNLRSARADSRRQFHECDFAGKWTRDQFLSDLMAQYGVFAESMAQYHKDLTSGVICKPDGLSMAGALAILSVGGTGALRAYPDLFENTRARYEAARGAF